MRYFSELFLEEKEIIESMYDVNAKNSNFTFNEKKATLNLTVPDYSEDEEPLFVICMEFNSDYPSSLPKIENLSFGKSYSYISEEIKAKIKLKLEQKMEEWKGNTVVLDVIDFLNSELENISTKTETKVIKKPSKQNSQDKQKVKSVYLENTNKKNIFYIEKDKYSFGFENKKKEETGEELLDSVNSKLRVKQSQIIIEPISFNKMKMETLSPNKSLYNQTCNEIRKKLRDFTSDKVPKDRIGYVHTEAHKILGNEKFIRKENSSFDSVFRRFGYASVMIGKKLFIQGGKDFNKTFCNLIRIDFNENLIENFEELDFFEFNQYSNYCSHSLYIPKMINHKMIAISGGILIFGTYNGGTQYRNLHFFGNSRRNEMMLFFISNPTTNAIHYGMNNKSKGKTKVRHPYRKSSCQDYIQNLENFTVSRMGGTILLFGGTNQEGKVTNDIYEISFSHSYTLTKYSKAKSITNLNETQEQPKDVIVWPRKRCQANGCVYLSNFYIFGGIDKEGNWINDLFVYNIGNSKWKEIELSFFPPVRNGCFIYPNNAGFSILGGLKPNLEDYNDTLYSFDHKEQRFYVLNTLTSFEKKYLQRTHFSVQSSENKGLIFGGKSVTGINQHLAKISNFSDGGKRIKLLKFLKLAREHSFFTDVCFEINYLCKDTKTVKNGELEAHLSLIFCRCKKLGKKILKEFKKQQKNNDTDDADDEDKKKYRFRITKYPPDVVQCFLDFLYTGDLILSGKQEISQILDLAKEYSPRKLYPLLKRQCSKTQKTMEITSSIFFQIQNDLKSLFLMHKEKKEHHDLKLVFADGSVMYLHKLFLVRSQFFQKMLKKNTFKESIDSEIDFSTFKKEIVVDIMTYLYSDIVLINEENCIEVLIYSLKFLLPVISQYCRRFVADYLEEDNVIDLLKLADFYNDKILSSICQRYVVDNFEVISNKAKFSSINSVLQYDLKQRHLKIEQRKEKKIRKFKTLSFSKHKKVKRRHHVW